MTVKKCRYRGIFRNVRVVTFRRWLLEAVWKRYVIQPRRTITYPCYTACMHTACPLSSTPRFVLSRESQISQAKTPFLLPPLISLLTRTLRIGMPFVDKWSLKRHIVLHPGLNSRLNFRDAAAFFSTFYLRSWFRSWLSYATKGK